MAPRRQTRGHLAMALVALLALAGCSDDETGDGARPSTSNGSSGEGAGGQGAAGSGSGATGTGGDAGSSGVGGTPAEFWDPSGIPPAQNVMVFKFLNRTNGQYSDDEVFWSFEHDGMKEIHSIAEQPTFDMPANASGRMYFYLGSPDSDYFDFIEHTIGDDQYNGNTTRVDAFGLKIAMRLHCADGFEATVGETYETFAEPREATFQAFLDAVPDEFDHLAQDHAPFRIVQPGAGEFDPGKMYEHYYDSFADELWAANGITLPKPGPNGSGLGGEPNLSAALMRHVGAVPGTFAPDGELLDDALWDDATTFYGEAPADYYAKFWHDRGIDGKAYGFPYDDVGGYSTYISHGDPEYLMIAIGW